MRKSFLFISLAAVMAAPVASARTLSPSEALDRATAEAVMPVSRSGGSPELIMTLGQACKFVQMEEKMEKQFKHGKG